MNRNPLAAISNAGQLLNEDARDPVLKRLAAIVRENTQRLNRLVEDVLRVARREPPLGDEIALGDFARNFLDEFVRDRGLPSATIEAQFTPDQRVKFEQSHLRQVLYNLVDNALLAMRAGPGCRLRHRRFCAGRRSTAAVGARTAPAFPLKPYRTLRPFFTTRNQGTGLGLFLAREFCVTNRAELSYASRREIDGSSRDGFLLRFGLGSRADASLHGFLDTIPIR
jgi:two-component system sensor histidine kinase PilS (NtrC family)